jgi:thioredoxin-dependent peroxiredoxin
MHRITQLVRPIDLKEHTMVPIRTFGWLFSALVGIILFTGVCQAQVGAEVKALKRGDTAKDFEFQPLEGKKKVKLSALAKEGPVVLVVLRGFPGYQCPLCSRQVNDFREHAEEFSKLQAKVVFVYPGPAADLKQRAHEFLKDDALPKPLMLVVDPAYQFTDLYGLRWEAANETAYPSTFVLDPQRVVKYLKVSKSHGDRTKAEEVLDVLAAMKFAASAKGEEIPGDFRNEISR